MKNTIGDYGSNLVVGKIETKIGKVNLWRTPDDPAGVCHAKFTLGEIGLPADHPTAPRPDGKGGIFQAPIFQAPSMNSRP